MSAFYDDLERDLRDPEFARYYLEALAEIQAADALHEAQR